MNNVVRKIMLFSYNWLQSFFSKKLPKPEKLAELLTMHSFETICQKPKAKSQEAVLDIDVLSNRGADCFSHLGIAREIAAILNLRLKIENSKLKEEKNFKTKNFVNVEVRLQQACSRYTARVICDVDVGPSPKWIKDRLEVCGLRAINNIVDIVNYVMLETGQPLHAFDFEKIESARIKNQKSSIKNIIVRKARKGEKIVTLDNEKYDLDQDILVIADIKGPLAIAGIKGGKRAEIDKKTKIVVLESANFNPQVIRYSSKTIDLKTDASWRFEHGLDPNLTEFAINRAAYLIQQIADGKIAQGLVDFYPKKVLPKKMKLDLDYVEKLLGLKIPEREIKSILERLGFKITRQLVNSLTPQFLIEVPSFRLDISLPEDLIEEIARIYGYEKIPATFPIVSLIPPKRNLDIFWQDRIKDILKGVGFSEVYNYSFIAEKDEEIFGNRELIEIENPTSSDCQYLRPSLIPNLLKNVQRNQKKFKEIKIFELGKTFRRVKTQFSKSLPQKEVRKGAKLLNKELSSWQEKTMLAGAMTGEAFYQAKGVVDLLLNKLGISNIWYDEYQPTPEESKISIWQRGRSAEIKIDGREIGFLGEISPNILAKLKIENKLVIFDIDFENLAKLVSEEQEYRPISKYPAVVRDLAILIPRYVRVEEVLNKIEIAGGVFLRDVDIFDIYEGEEIPEGKKNLAFHLIYQAEDHTLTTDEIEKIHGKIIKALEEDPEWQVRK